MFRPMKPETIERRRVQAIQERHARMRDSLDRTKQLVERDGPDSIWAELYAEQLERNKQEGI